MCGDGCNDCGALKTAHAGKLYIATKIWIMTKLKPKTAFAGFCHNQNLDNYENYVVCNNV